MNLCNNATKVPGRSPSLEPRTAGILMVWIVLAALWGCSEMDHGVDSGVMTLVISGVKVIQNPSDEEILFELSNLDTKKEDSFAILGPSDMTYIQVAGDKNVGFDLEYQEGDVRSHFTARNEKITLDQAVDAFVAYLNGRTDWRDRFEFEKSSW